MPGLIWTLIISLIGLCFFCISGFLMEKAETAFVGLMLGTVSGLISLVFIFVFFFSHHCHGLLFFICLLLSLFLFATGKESKKTNRKYYKF
jgi:hypothetical protein